MDIKSYQATVDKWIKEVGVRYFDILTNMAILAEETGEVARIIARGWGEQSFKASEWNGKEPDLETFRKQKLADELSDLIWVATCIANQTGIDLESALQANIEKKTMRDSARHKENEKLK